MDVALDTVAVNSMTTALDIAYTGLPAVCSWGERMNTRFSGMVATNLGLVGSVAGNVKEFEEMAVSLGRDI